ncbi:SusC/RagA family TonB-linked outer membrane protein [Dysgonomonas sp. ZJ279]|uniref:SusC/RagA family TonB-linked outer membrane protein n=1 Tax=Dysgonomonas sp. ZJ279 TaxID=2709796 RepID=UPI0013EE3479|nr:TonB-dependent receptor [Dysgonomonas sp. ZJ279]
MKKRVMLILSCLFLSIGFIAAQIKVSGVVVDQMGEAVIGASVVVKNTTVGTITDVDGNFTISVPANRNTLVFAIIGMRTKEEAVSPNMRVVMEEDAALLDEVVITGYGVTKKRAFTGAASSLDATTIASRTDANPIKALDGIIPGLQMNIASGQPGAPANIYIRGRNSINSGTQPLYIIDGVPINADPMGIRKSEGSEISPLSTLNASDIENITVLKDATATSIYGARAANGVIVITTKRGSGGRTSVNFTAKMGYEARPRVPKNYKTVNAAEYTELYVESMQNDYRVNGADSGTAYYLGNDYPLTAEGMRQFLYDDSEAVAGTDTDWFKEVTRTGFVQEYGLDIQGGGESSTAAKYFLSFNYLSNEAFIRGKDLSRYSLRLNLDQAPSKFVRFGVNTNLSLTETNMGAGGGYFSDPVTLAYQLSPLYPVKDEKGDWFFNQTGYNPVAQRSELGDKTQGKQYRMLISPYVQLYLPKDLVFQSKLGVDLYFLDEFGYWSFLQPQGASIRGLGENANSRNLYITWTNTLNYSKTFGEKHHLNVLLGQEIQKTSMKEAYLEATNYAVDYLTEVELASVPSTASTTRNDVALASFFANAEYDYMSKYYLSGSFRYDGSSRFGSNHRWASFWSVGGKYRLTEEQAVKDATESWLDNATLRMSYGTTGNQEVGSQDSNVEDNSPLYASRNLYYFGRNYNGLPGSGHLQWGNPDLKWEQTNKFNVGVDFSFLKRFTVEVDYYNHKTTDMVFNVPISMVTGLQYYLTNIGELSNHGFEVSLNANIIRSKDLDWSVLLTAAKNKNEVKKLSTDAPIETATTIIKAGSPLNSFKMKEWAGVDPETGNPTWYLNAEGDETTTSYARAAKRELGDANPTLQGAFSTTLRWKNFDLLLQLNYSLGGKIYGNHLRYDEQVGSSAWDTFTKYVYDNRWQKPGDITDVPSMMFLDDRNSNAASSRFLMDGDFLKIRALAFGYNIPSEILKSAKIANARVFVNADNIYTFAKSNYRGFDPSGVAANGIQWWNYPTPRTVLFGLTLGF